SVRTINAKPKTTSMREKALTVSSRRERRRKRRKYGIRREFPSFPVGHVGVFALAAVLSVGAKGVKVIIAMLAGKPVDVRPLPGIEWNVFSEVRAIPSFEAAGPRA